MVIEEKYMRRALQLARLGYGRVSPNPMVGAVIVSGGRIIGEGFHRRWGEGHAEVNAINSVSADNESLLSDSTLYVTLEPCSHYGKTPPCSKLIIERRIPRVVVGSLDPFKEVSGRGIAMLRQAGVEVVCGVLEDECRELNRKFMTAHSCQRPYILLKWAETANGKIDSRHNDNKRPLSISTPANTVLVHRLRAGFDAILIGNGTLQSDNPSLTPRRWTGKAPVRVVMTHGGCANPESRKLLIDGGRTIIFSNSGNTLDGEYENVEEIAIPDPANALASSLKSLYQRGVTSVMVEGGARILRKMIDAGLWDEIRVERSTKTIGNGVEAPEMPRHCFIRSEEIDGHTILHARKSDFRLCVTV